MSSFLLSCLILSVFDAFPYFILFGKAICSFTMFHRSYSSLPNGQHGNKIHVASSQSDNYDRNSKCQDIWLGGFINGRPLCKSLFSKWNQFLVVNLIRIKCFILFSTGCLIDCWLTMCERLISSGDFEAHIINECIDFVIYQFFITREGNREMNLLYKWNMSLKILQSSSFLF